MEAQGQSFLQAASEALQEGKELEELADIERAEEGIVWRTFEQGAFRLQVGITSESGILRVVSWRIQKEWELDEDLNLWPGEA